MEIISENPLVKGWTKGVQVEPQARQQLCNAAGMPFIFKWLAAMPDVHWGMGATIGSVIATKGAIIPAAVGVDLGCGMIASRTNLRAKDLPDSLASLRSSIEAAVPHGRTANGHSGDRGAWDDIPQRVNDVWENLDDGFLKIITAHPKIAKGNLINHLGTLGTGNHFIEICLDTEGAVWIMLHSGSRGVGNRIGCYFIEKAKEDMRRYFINLPDQDLAYLPEGSRVFEDYCNAVEWAQDFALANRKLMMSAVYRAINLTLKSKVVHGLEEAINCHHNYISKENHYNENVWVTRKGAVRARIGDLGIIPGSMGAKSFIVIGKGNPESFHSCSHGAGRTMSRAEARRRISLEDHIAAVAGVECRLDADVIDESPAAYKDIDAVMAAQAELVDIKYTLKQILCVKG